MMFEQHYALASDGHSLPNELEVTISLTLPIRGDNLPQPPY